jgi:hypothetical protein
VSVVGGRWPTRAGQKIAQRKGGGELVVVWSRSRSIDEMMGGRSRITELQFGSTGGGPRGMKSSGCLLRLAVVIERHLI